MKRISSKIIVATAILLSAHSAIRPSQAQAGGNDVGHCEIHMVPAELEIDSNSAGKKSLKLVKLLIRDYPVLFSRAHALIVIENAHTLRIDPRTFAGEVDEARNTSNTPPENLVKLASASWSDLKKLIKTPGFWAGVDKAGAETISFGKNGRKGAQSLIASIEANPAAEEVFLQFLRNTTPAFLKSAQKLTDGPKPPTFVVPDAEVSFMARLTRDLLLATLATTGLQTLNWVLWDGLAIIEPETGQWVGAGITSVATGAVLARAIGGQLQSKYYSAAQWIRSRLAARHAMRSAAQDPFFDKQRFVMTPDLVTDTSPIDQFDFGGFVWKIPHDAEIASQSIPPSSFNSLSLDQIQNLGLPLIDSAQALALISSRKAAELHSFDEWKILRSRWSQIQGRLKKGEKIPRSTLLHLMLPEMRARIEKQKSHFTEISRLQSVLIQVKGGLERLALWLRKNIDAQDVNGNSSLRQIQTLELSESILKLLEGAALAADSNFELLLSLEQEVKAKQNILEEVRRQLITFDLADSSSPTLIQPTDLKALEALWQKALP